MLRHTIDGRQVLTIEDLAERYGVKENTVVQVIYRAEKADKPIPVAGHCGRKALYDPKMFDAHMKSRPNSRS